MFSEGHRAQRPHAHSWLRLACCVLQETAEGEGSAAEEEPAMPVGGAADPPAKQVQTRACAPDWLLALGAIAALRVVKSCRLGDSPNLPSAHPPTHLSPCVGPSSRLCEC